MKELLKRIGSYNSVWTAAASLVGLTSVAGATGDASSIADNVVCLNLITFMVVAMLPSRDIVEALLAAAPFDFKKGSTNE